MAALARSRSAVRYDFKGQPDDSTAWPEHFPARRSLDPKIMAHTNGLIE